MPKLKTNKAASKRYSYTASGKVKEHQLTQDTDQLQKQKDKKCQEDQMLMQIKHVKQVSKNVTIWKLENRKVNKKWQE